MRAGKELSIPVTGTDPDGELLSLEAQPLPGGAELRRTPGTNRWTLSWVPSKRQRGRHVVDLIVSDGAGASETQSVTIVVLR